MTAIKFDKGKPEARYVYTEALDAILDGFTNEYVDISDRFPQLLEQLQKTKDRKVAKIALRSLLRGADKRNRLKEFLFDLSKVSKLGADKYGQYNYQEGMEPERILDATYRHFIQFIAAGYCYSNVNLQQLDNESNVNHIVHVAANLCMLIHILEDKKDATS